MKYSMDELEKWIVKNREAIQQDQPGEGHLDRFEMKLASKGKIPSRYWIGFLSGIAAVLVIGLFFFLPRGQEERPKSITLAELSGQYAETEYYFTRSIDQQQRKLAGYSGSLEEDSARLNLIIREMKEYDHVYEQLCIDLNTAPNDERVINAMLTYYQTKLEILNRIINEIEKKQLKKNENEDISI